MPATEAAEHTEEFLETLFGPLSHTVHAPTSQAIGCRPGPSEAKSASRAKVSRLLGCGTPYAVHQPGPGGVIAALAARDTALPYVAKISVAGEGGSKTALRANVCGLAAKNAARDAHADYASPAMSPMHLAD